ncbi:MAG: succinate dehydrogenase/fumarate reductase iron-sulfur subunit [Bdellovibrionia bacterium]
MKIHLKIWKQEKAQGSSSQDAGHFMEYTLDGVSENMSFLEMLDYLNEELLKKGERPIEFDSDCREGICGSCSCVINGQPHGPERGAATCQVYMRKFSDGQTIVVEPWRAKAMPVIKDLVVDRSALDRIVQAGGYISVKTGPHADANAILISKEAADAALDAATCIQCGACVAACPNASASLFTAAQVTRFAMLPQGQVESLTRVRKMVDQMDHEGFGHCSNIGECEAACPKRISIDSIAVMRKEYWKALRASR